MTDGAVTQAGVEVLFKVTPDARVAQAGVEVLHRVGVILDVTQAGVEYLHRVQPSFSVTQAGVEVLYKHVPCGTQWCQAWTITRTDGEVYRFTSLDRDLEWGGVTFKACGSLTPSASENADEVGSVGNIDLSGMISESGITRADLYAGLFDGASVEAWLVDWGSGGAMPKALLRGTFGPVDVGETGFRVEIQGDGGRLTQTPLVRLLQLRCRWQFGAADCGKDLGPLTVTGTVDAGSGQRAFTDAARGEAAGYFGRGRVTFTSGVNAGISAEIKSHEAGGVFELWPRLPYAIAGGDEYSMTPGCTNIVESAGGTNGCTAWGRYVAYGGFKFVPGSDAIARGANVRAPG